MCLKMTQHIETLLCQTVRWPPGQLDMIITMFIMSRSHEALELKNKFHKLIRWTDDNIDSSTYHKTTCCSEKQDLKILAMAQLFY